MEENLRTERVVQHVRQYLENRWNLFLLNTSDKASGLISSVASILLIGVSMVFVLLFLSVGAAIWIGSSTGNSSVGFLYVGLFYLVVSIILLVSRKQLIKIPVINKMINALHADEEN